MRSRIRALLAAVVFLAMALIFIDYTGVCARLWGGLASAQVLPAVLAFNFVFVLVLVAVTLLFGRVYCSILCPLGIMQDGFWWLRRKIHKPRRRKYRHPTIWLRTALAVLLVALLVLGGFGLVADTWAGLLDPYSIFGRIMSGVAAPATDAAAAAAGDALVEHGYYLLYTPARIAAGSVMILGALMLVFVTAMAVVTGRRYCTDLCPVGTLLGCLSRKSLFRPVIASDKCVKCGLCESVCPSSCIDSSAGSIDASRCVMCLDCLDVCKTGALKFTRAKVKTAVANAACNSPASPGRRSFITFAGLSLGTAAGLAADGGLARLIEKQPRRNTPVTPAGSGGVSRLTAVCTACGLCMGQCPEGILKASSSLERWMQPEMDFTHGFCPPSCNLCGQLCPAGAIRPVETRMKTRIRTGLAIVDNEACRHCGMCADKCPTRAITMVAAEGRRPVPVVNASLCVGCGACEYYCPVGTVADKSKSPYAAIHVEGYELHHTS